MRRAFLLLTLVALALAQTNTPQAQIGVTFGGVRKTWDIALPAKPPLALSDFSCRVSMTAPLALGATSVCTITLNQPVPADTLIPVSIPAGIFLVDVHDGPDLIRVVAGSASATFTIFRPWDAALARQAP